MHSDIFLTLLTESLTTVRTSQGLIANVDHHNFYHPPPAAACRGTLTLKLGTTAAGLFLAFDQTGNFNNVRPNLSLPSV